MFQTIRGISFQIKTGSLLLKKNLSYFTLFLFYIYKEQTLFAEDIILIVMIIN